MMIDDKNPNLISFKSNPRTRSNSKKAKKSTIHSNNKSIDNDIETIKNVVLGYKIKAPVKRKIKRCKLSSSKPKKKMHIKSETSSLKRKAKNPSSSPRNNIEDMMQQFLIMKNQTNQNSSFPKYVKENIITPEFSKEQTNSILNISAQPGNNLSFINYKILTQDKRPKSKESKISKFTEDHSPKYPLKKGETQHPKMIDKKLIRQNPKMKNKVIKEAKSINPNLIYRKGKPEHQKINVAFSLIDKNWKHNDAIDRSRTHDERNAELFEFKGPHSIKNDQDYSTFALNTKPDRTNMKSSKATKPRHAFNYKMFTNSPKNRQKIDKFSS